MSDINIRTLKQHLGPGLGLRKNRYMLELPVPTVNGATLNILCQSAGLPERNISTTDLWHKGRRYTVRGETDYIGEYEISIVDDSEMQIRQLFDTWLKQIDNTRPDKNSSLLGASFEELNPSLLETIGDGVKLANMVKNTVQNPRQLLDFAIGQIDPSAALATAAYQVDINIWQINHSQSPVYGYKLQNAFPKSIGVVTLEDNDENTLSEFSVVFAFSEFIPLYGTKEDLLRGIIGDQATDILDGVRQFTGL
jgi:hypothetical protein